MLGEHPKIWDPLRISATVEASNFKFDTPLGFGTSLPKTVLDQNWRGLGQGSIQKNGTPYVFLQPLKLAISYLVHKLGLGLAYQKRRLGPKLAGVLARGASKKIWDHYVFFQPLKLAISNLVHNLGLGLAYQKQRFGWTKIGGGPGQGSIQKIGTPYVFLQPLKPATSNLVHNFVSKTEKFIFDAFVDL